MITSLVALAACAFLYGFAWHNQPSREQENAEDPTFGKPSQNRLNSIRVERTQAKR